MADAPHTFSGVTTTLSLVAQTTGLPGEVINLPGVMITEAVTGVPRDGGELAATVAIGIAVAGAMSAATPAVARGERGSAPALSVAAAPAATPDRGNRLGVASIFVPLSFVKAVLLQTAASASASLT